MDLILDLIDPPVHDVRLERTEDYIEQLAADLASNGQINAITVRPIGDRYECETGWTRCLAMRRLNRLTIRAEIIDDDDAWRAQRRRFAENHQRAQLTPIEEARELASMQREHAMSVQQLATTCRRSEHWVELRLALLDLPEDLQAHVQAGTLSIGAAVILGNCTDRDHRAYLLTYAINSGASIDVLRQWVQQWRIAAEAGTAQQLTLPPMPIPGAAIIIQIPCARCDAHHDYRQSRAIQICRGCYEEMTHANTTAPSTR